MNEPSSSVATPCVSVFRIMQCKVLTDAINRQLFRFQMSLTAFITRTAVRRPWRRGTEDLKCRLDVAPRGRMFAQRSCWLASTRHLLQSRTAAGPPQSTGLGKNPFGFPGTHARSRRDKRARVCLVTCCISPNANKV